MPSTLIQQLFNILQAANVQAVKLDEDEANCRPLLTSLFLANGATYDASPLPPPTEYVGDYLVYYQSPGGEEALLTRAQAEVIMQYWDLHEAEGLIALNTQPLGCCMNSDGQGTNNVAPGKCPIPPNQSWSQGACGGQIEPDESE